VKPVNLVVLPLHEGVLPRAVRRRENLLDSHALHAMPKSLTVDAVTVAEEVGRRGLVREGLGREEGAAPSDEGEGLPGFRLETVGVRRGSTRPSVCSTTIVCHGAAPESTPSG
jgi:hypothetical protein